MSRLLVLFFLLNFNLAIGQVISGVVVNDKNDETIEYTNIGILGKNIGTVSDSQGKFSIDINSQFNNDSLLFSSIGYFPKQVKVSELRNGNVKVALKEKVYEIKPVVVTPRIFKPKTLGVSTRSKMASAGFENNLLGYEMGIIMKVKKTAKLKSVNLNFSVCSYDSLFYRLNIYKVTGPLAFENILENPIYLSLTKNDVKETVRIDLEKYNLVMQGYFLVTIEHVKDLGDGRLYFCAGLKEKTYYRKTSQGEWKTAPVGISISVDADVEK
ncbi:MAG: carboxypeptidase-like regulatory domain-containing protein [Bacteroidales bacterium]|nr:MAG: carboxypeptidase-like regulatory domain-containing protein [Bacteroidales bacterium]